MRPEPLIRPSEATHRFRARIAGAIAATALASCAGAQAVQLESSDWQRTIDGESYRVLDVYVRCASPSTRILIAYDPTIVLLAEPGAVFVQAAVPGQGPTSRPICAEMEWGALWEVDTYLALGGEQCEIDEGFTFTPKIPHSMLVNSGGYSGPGGWFLMPPLFDAQFAGPDLRVRLMRLTIREDDWHPDASVAIALKVGWTPAVGAPAQFTGLGAYLGWGLDPAPWPEVDQPGSGGGGGTPGPEVKPGSLAGANAFWRSAAGYVTGWRVEGTELASAASWMPSIAAHLSPAGRGDFDGDGNADFLFRSAADGSIEMWVSQLGEPAGHDYVATAPQPGPSQWEIVAIADVSGDGRDDILWRRVAGSSRTVRAWHMHGSTLLDDRELGMSIGLEFLGCGDLNGDGRNDLLWRSLGGSIVAWRSNANGSVTPLTVGNVPALPAAWRLEAFADLNGDGVDDFVWHNVETGHVNGWLVQNFARVAGGPISHSVPATWRVIGAVDLDDNGTVDLLWRNDSSGQANAWCMSGLVRTSGGPVAGVPNTWKPIR